MVPEGGSTQAEEREEADRYPGQKDGTQQKSGEEIT
jgi:hypothetical protein